MTIEELKAQAQALADALNAFELPAATNATVTEVDVKESDGTEETFVPQA